MATIVIINLVCVQELRVISYLTFHDPTIHLTFKFSPLFALVVMQGYLKSTPTSPLH